MVTLVRQATVSNLFLPPLSTSVYAKKKEFEPWEASPFLLGKTSFPKVLDV